MVSEILVNNNHNEDIILQVSDMVREAVDNALRQLTANGGGRPVQQTGYTHRARTAQELRESKSQAAPNESGRIIPKERKGFPGFKGEVKIEKTDEWAY